MEEENVSVKFAPSPTVRWPFLWTQVELGEKDYATVERGTILVDVFAKERLLDWVYIESQGNIRPLPGLPG